MNCITIHLKYFLSHRNYNKIIQKCNNIDLTLLKNEQNLCSNCPRGYEIEACRSIGTCLNGIRV